MWLQSRMVTAPAPLVPAVSARTSTASWAADWPNPQWPSMTAVAAARWLTSGWAAGRIWPSAIQPEYWISRMMPWESWPTRLDRTRETATWRAIGAGAPRAASAAVVNVSRSAGAKRPLAGPPWPRSPVAGGTFLGYSHLLTIIS